MLLTATLGYVRTSHCVRNLEEVELG